MATTNHGQSFVPSRPASRMVSEPGAGAGTVPRRTHAPATHAPTGPAHTSPGTATSKPFNMHGLRKHSNALAALRSTTERSHVTLRPPLAAPVPQRSALPYEAMSFKTPVIPMRAAAHSPSLDEQDLRSSPDAYMYSSSGDDGKRGSPDEPDFTYGDAVPKRPRTDDAHFGAYMQPVPAYTPAASTSVPALDSSLLEQWCQRHPEVRQRARERWTTCTREEWARGVDELGEKFKQILRLMTDDMTKREETYDACYATIYSREKELTMRGEVLAEKFAAFQRNGVSVINGGTSAEEGDDEGEMDGEAEDVK